MEVPKELPQSFVTTRYVSEGGFELFSYNTLQLRNWFVRVSITETDTIMAVLTHVHLGLTKIAFFNDEVKAHQFIQDVISTD